MECQGQNSHYPKSIPITAPIIRAKDKAEQEMR